MKAYMLNYKPIVIHDPPEHKLRHLCFTLVERPWFDMFIIGCIVLNSIALALNWYGEDP
jgi:hypothetical protein